MPLVDDINVLVEKYLEFLRSRINLREVGDTHVAISTPFIDRHNDGFVIYISRSTGDKFMLTDDGEILTDLEHSGCTFDTPSRKSALETILLSNSVTLHNGELKVETNAADFAEKKSSLLNAMMELDKMYVLAENRTRNFFFEDVKSWLDGRKVGYALNMKLPGSSGYMFPVDFFIGRGSDPEMAIQTLAAPDVSSLSRMIVMKEELCYRKTDVRVILNDEKLSGQMEKDLSALSESRGLPISFWSSHEISADILG